MPREKKSILSFGPSIISCGRSVVSFFLNSHWYSFYIPVASGHFHLRQTLFPPTMETRVTTHALIQPPSISRQKVITGPARVELNLDYNKHQKDRFRYKTHEQKRKIN